jgi:putative PIN family toxin of toxin-antitoxin system
MAERKQAEIFVSRDILSEINRVLRYEKITKILERGNQDVTELMSTILALSTLVETESKVQVITEDPSDNMFLACSRDAGAEFIISGDQHLLQLGRYGEASIVSPSAFLNLIQRPTRKSSKKLKGSVERRA